MMRKIWKQKWNDAKMGINFYKLHKYKPKNVEEKYQK